MNLEIATTLGALAGAVLSAAAAIFSRVRSRSRKGDHASITITLTDARGKTLQVRKVRDGDAKAISEKLQEISLN